MRRILIATALLLPALNAFVPLGCYSSRRTCQHNTLDDVTSLPVTALQAKKRRRRKAPAPAEESQTTSSSMPVDSNSFGTGDELPDFDLGEDGDEQPAAKKMAAISDPDVITPAMMGSTSTPVRSIKDLISDRSLEQNFEFDGTEAVPTASEQLPDLVEMMKGQKTRSDSVSGKKKTRQAERRAAAMAREQQEKDEEAGPLEFLSGVTFLQDRETGKVTYLKIVEAGTWLAIITLIGW
eukprot:CAMPEP_0168726272 /NCGR_PEP_ID=MMETSP0724-20121128/4583_1 /TAXON_ID=265536 /ORGANISM="Amphiprora sp., Strain CCMP467" /LENGTH=237 /DNA_ID=CAMNT_0008773081 /DNA_START=67 /DNA_END=777 /DNA_ORIENTATION=-